MGTELSPAELARATGVSTDTLRHYERKAVLALPHRTPAGYRCYPADAVARVSLIQRALVVGFSLDELARVLRERDHGGAPCRKVRALVGDRIADVDRRLTDLRKLRRELAALARDWDARLDQTPAGSRAHLLETLASRPGLAGHRPETRPLRSRRS